MCGFQRDKLKQSNFKRFCRKLQHFCNRYLCGCPFSVYLKDIKNY